MGKDIKEQSTEELKRKVKTGKVTLIVCWSAIIISIVITLFYGKSLPSIAAFSAGFAGLGIVTIAMLIGGKKIKEEMARRNDSQNRTVD
jgi:hypothetical protein